MLIARIGVIVSVVVLLGSSPAFARPSQQRIADVKERMAKGKLVCGQTMNTSRKNPKPLAARTIEALEWVCAGKN